MTAFFLGLNINDVLRRRANTVIFISGFILPGISELLGKNCITLEYSFHEIDNYLLNSTRVLY